MYLFCDPCGRNHSKIGQKGAADLIALYQAGEGHIVTKWGVEPICLLNMLERTENHVNSAA
jgi:hypothetical protein